MSQHVRRRLFVGVVSLLFCGCIAAADAQPRAPSGRAVIAWHVTIAPSWFDPSTAPPQITPFGMLYAIHDALVRPYPGQKMGPSLAESWSESEDGLTYEFRLRPNLKFHNGDPLTTEDVKFSFERYHGAAAKTLHEHVTQVEIVDPRVVRFHLTAPWPDFMTFFGTTASGAGIVAAEEVPDRDRRRRLQEASDRRRSVPLRQHQAGHRGGARGVPRLLAARAEREDAGDAQRPRGDHARADGADRRGRHRLCARRPRCRGPAEGPASRSCATKHASIFWIEFARAVGPEIAMARHPRLRQAVNYALDRRASTTRRASAFCPPAGVIVPRVMEFALQVEPPPYDPDEGEALLAEAGYPNGIDAGDFAAIPGFPTVAEAVVNDLNAVGIRVRLRQMERATFYATWLEKKLPALYMVASGNSGNAASRVEIVHLVEGRLCQWRLSRHRRVVPAPGRRARHEEARGDARPDPAADDRPGDVRADHGPACAERASGRA